MRQRHRILWLLTLLVSTLLLVAPITAAPTTSEVPPPSLERLWTRVIDWLFDGLPLAQQDDLGTVPDPYGAPKAGDGAADGIGPAMGPLGAPEVEEPADELGPFPDPFGAPEVEEPADELGPFPDPYG